MADELYLSNYEAALAVVASSMKKARQPIVSLAVNSFMGGVLFTSGSMLYVQTAANSFILEDNTLGFVSLLRASLFSIGLFYVVITGSDLFNSNILFFSVGLCRKAISILDLSISWMVSYWLNLVANIFVGYLFCKYTDISNEAYFIEGSVKLLMEKASRSFIQTFLRGIAGNFYVSLAIYLQIMVKPLHVKFLCLFLPVVTFVGIGFTHCVADMFIVVMGLINGAPISVATVAWRLMLPAAIGNIIGGSFFGIVAWFLHIYLVELDQKILRIPEYDNRDVQPELNSDSRVVRQKFPSAVDDDDIDFDADSKEKNYRERVTLTDSNTGNEDYLGPRSYYPQSINDSQNISRVQTGMTSLSRNSALSRKTSSKSPKNVFPIFGMSLPGEREKAIASGEAESEETMDDLDDDNYSAYTASSSFRRNKEGEATYIGTRLKKILTKKSTNGNNGNNGNNGSAGSNYEP